MHKQIGRQSITKNVGLLPKGDLEYYCLISIQLTDNQ